MPKPGPKFETRKTLTSPPVVCRYPRLNNPDTKWKEEGEYSLAMVLDTSLPEHAAFVEQLEAVWAEALAEAEALEPKKSQKRADKPWKTDEEDPALLILRPKMRAKTTKRDGTIVDRRPALFDAKGKPMSTETWIKGGSTVRVNFTLSPFLTPSIGFGLAVYLNAVQGVRLVETDSFEAYGFDAVDDSPDPDGDPTPDWGAAYDNAGAEEAKS